MEKLKILNHHVALSLLMNEPLYLIKEKQGINNQNKEEYLKRENTPGKIVILVHYQSVDVIPQLAEKFLSKVLAALGMTLTDVILVNTLSRQDVNFSYLKDTFLCNKLILFGQPEENLQIPVQDLYSINKISDMDILLVEELERIDSDKNKKAQLWTLLKQFFNV